MPLSTSDQNVVSNLRREYGDKLNSYTDKTIAQAWRFFSQSDEYPDQGQSCFPSWCNGVADGSIT